MSPVRVMQFSIVAAVFIGIVSCKSPNKNSESSALVLSGNRTSEGGTSGSNIYRLSCSTIGLSSRPDPSEVASDWEVFGRSTVEGRLTAGSPDENQKLWFKKVDLDIKLFNGFRSTTPNRHIRYRWSEAHDGRLVASYTIGGHAKGSMWLHLSGDTVTGVGVLKLSRRTTYGFIAIPYRGLKYAVKCDPLAPSR